MAAKRKNKKNGVRADVQFVGGSMVIKPTTYLSPEEFSRIRLKAFTLGIECSVVYVVGGAHAFSIPNSFNERAEELINLFSPKPAMGGFA